MGAGAATAAGSAGASCEAVIEPLNSLMPLPSDLPSSGSFFGPKTIRAMISTTMISIGPTLGMVPRIGWCGWGGDEVRLTAGGAGREARLRDGRERAVP